MNYKKEMAILSGLFVIALFVGVNMMTSTSYPGIAGGHVDCWNCHQGPIFASESSFSADIGAWPDAAHNNAWPSQRYDQNYFFMMNVEDAHAFGIIHAGVQFVMNSTHMQVKVSYSDDTAKFENSTNPDMFAILFNIDAYGTKADEEFSLFDFYEAGLAMATLNGSLDLWWASTADFAANATGKAKDYVIGGPNGGGLAPDPAADQDVYVGVHYGEIRDGVMGYNWEFTRPLTTSSVKDVQFHKGDEIQVAVAQWNDTKVGEAHFSSYTYRMVIGELAPESVTTTATVDHTVTNEVTTTVSSGATGGSVPSFTIVFVMVGLLIAVPLIAKKRK
jgi:hypothetical protein